MKDQWPSTPDSLSLAHDRLVDRLCDRFEAAWRADRPPLLERYLRRAPAEARPHLLRELLALELTYRRERNDRPAVEEYCRRFPEQAGVVRDAFAARPTPLPQASPQLVAKWKLSWLLNQALAAEDFLGPDESTAEQIDPHAPPREPSSCPADAPRGKLEREYVFLGRLGKGGMGVVYKALERRTDRVVALKVIRPDLLEAAAPEERRWWVESFRRAAALTGRFDHGHIVPLYHVGEDRGQLYYVMRYVEGRSLGEMVREDGPLPRGRAARYVEQVARAVQYAHDCRVLHCDLKPRNVLIDAREDRAFLTDFGLARPLGSTADGFSALGPAGTYSYMSPEQAQARPRCQPASDVYGLGATLYDLVAGRPPFQGGDPVETLRQVREDEPVSPRRLNPAVDADLETIILTCLRKEPARRYASAAALADDLANYRAGRPIKARPAGRVERCWRWCRNNPRRALTYSAAALVALAATALAAFGTQMHRVATARQESLVAAAGREQDLTYERGQEHCRRGDAALGLLWKIRALESSPYRNEDLENHARRDLAAWGRDLHTLKAFLPLGKSLSAAAFSPDGKFLVTGGEDRTVRVWHMPTGRLRFAEPLVHAEPVSALAVCPDGRTLAVVSHSFVSLWDLAAGKPLRSLRGEGADVFRSAAFHPDGQTILTARTNGSLQRWRAATGDLLGSFPTGGDVSAVTFSVDGKTALLVGKDKTARLWNLATMQSSDTHLLPHDNPVTGAAFSPDGRTVLTGSGDAEYRRGEVRRWDAATGQRLPLLHAPLRGPVRQLVLGREGAGVFTVTKDYHDFQGDLHQWDMASGRLLGLFPVREDVSVRAFSPDGKYFLTADGAGTGQLWATAEGSRPAEVARRAEANEIALALARDPTGTKIAVASSTKVTVWNKPLGVTLILRHKKVVFAAAFSPDGEMIATEGGEGIRLWDAATGEPLAPPRRQRGRVYALAFSPDGQTVAAGYNDGFQTWDVATREPLLDLHRPGYAVRALAFSPDGHSFAAGTYEGEARLWGMATGAPFGQPVGHQNAIRGIAFSPDGRWLLTGSGDTSAQFWEAATGRPHGPPLLHDGGVRGVAFSPDGRLAATASLDQTARLWDVATAKPVGPPLVHSFQVTAVAFTPDGRAVLTAGDQAVRAWPLAPPWRGGAGQMRRRVEWLTGLEQDPRGAARPLGDDAWRQRFLGPGGEGGAAAP